VDRNRWSKLLLGRDRGGAMQRAAGRQWMRWWGCAGGFLAMATFVPLSVLSTYSYDEKLREHGTPQTVAVRSVDPRASGSRFTVHVDNRDVELENPNLTPKVGDQVMVVVDVRGHVVLADSIGAENKAVGDAAFGVFVALIVFIGLGWGPGLAPYRAVRALRRPENLAHSAIVTIESVIPARPPQGRVWAAWHRGTGQYYELSVKLPDSSRSRWLGRGPRGLEPGTKACLVGPSSTGNWVALLVNVRNSAEDSVCWTAAPLGSAELT
jgi:hypothetical protein